MLLLGFNPRRLWPWPYKRHHRHLFKARLICCLNMNSTAGSADTDGSRERRLIGLGICLLIAAACLWPRNATVLRDTNGGSNSLRAAPLGHAHDPHRVLDTGVVDRAAPSPPPLPPPPRGDGSLISSSSSSSGGGLAANRVDSGTLTAAAAVPETNKYGRGGVKMQLGLASADRSLHDQQTLPVVAPPSPPAEFEMLLRDLEHDFAVTFERQQVYNPTLALAPANTDDDKRYDGLVMYTRFEGRNSVGRWQSCPTDTLYESQACPVPDLRMISFVVTCKLSAHFSCSGPLRALSYPIDWPRAMTTLNERELGPEDPRAFVWHGELWLAYNAPPLGVISSSPRTIRCMQVQRVEPTLSKPVNLVMTSLSSGRTEEKEEEEEEEKKGVKMGRYEKNWSPIKAEEKEGDAAAGDNNSLLSSRGGKYLFSTGVEPHTVSVFPVYVCVCSGVLIFCFVLLGIGAGT